MNKYQKNKIKTNGKARSNKWPTFKKHFQKIKPKICSVCGATKGKIELHHIIPFHKNRKKELDINNVIWLCENIKDGLNCHLSIGHLGSFRSFNKNVRRDAALWAKKIKNRP